MKNSIPQDLNQPEALEPRVLPDFTPSGLGSAYFHPFASQISRPSSELIVLWTVSSNLIIKRLMAFSLASLTSLSSSGSCLAAELKLSFE
jgi:hypothetical protein